MHRRCARPEERHPPVVQLQHLADDACGEGVPLTVQAGEHHVAAAPRAPGPRADRGDDPFRDAGRRMLLRDGPPAGLPQLPDAHLGGRDEFQQ